MAVGVDDSRFVESVGQCVDSVRRWGRFTGDIVVLTDSASAEVLATRSPAVSIVVTDVDQLVEADHGRERYERFQAARLCVHDVIDLSSYDTVMYLDADILAVRDIRPLFESVTEFRYAREFQPMSGPTFSGSLTDVELAEARWRRGINSGTFVAPARELPRVLDVWRAELDRSPGGVGYDQPALNAIVLRGSIRAAALPAMAVAFPILSNFEDHFTNDTRLLHYCGAPHLKFEWMRRDYEWLRAGSAIEKLPSAMRTRSTESPVTVGRELPAEGSMVVAIGDRNGVESHAMVNRALAHELERRGHRVIGLDTSDAGEPDVVIHHSFLRDFTQYSFRPGIPHVAIRTSDFGPHPAEWVERINLHYEQLWVPSEWIREHAVRGGVDPAKIRVVPNGVDRSTFRPHGPLYRLPTKKRFRFLFVGGSSIRKGLDILLRGYCDAFGPDDDVSLVVKDDSANWFYRDRTLAAEIERIAEDPSLPEVIYIDEHLSVDDLSALYRACDVGVWPYRAEGFLIPALESLACGTPTMIPEIGATADFSSSRSSYLLPTTRVQLPYPRQFRMRLGFDINVEEIDILEVKLPDLVDALRAAAATPPLELKEKAIHGVATAHGRFGWEHVGEIAEACLRDIVDAK